MEWKLSRREFLKSTGSFLVSLPLINTFGSYSSSNKNDPDEMYGFLVDVSRCIGCGDCQAACKIKNNLPVSSDLPYERNERSYWDNYSTLSAYTWTRIRSKKLVKDGKEIVRFIKEQCMHCIDPACASVCFVGALYKTPEGPVIYRADRCVGCRYCVYACPWGVPKWQYDKPFPFIQKCNMCYDRVIEGKKPACVEACKVGALTFGKRKELIEEAKRRISKGGYVNYIYGEEEAGGTCVLYISDVPFDELDFRKVMKFSYPELTQAYLGNMPIVIPSLFVGLLGLYLYSRRRQEVKR
ncbi:MAG: 4Fe-4S dicluster domain-containing protein [Candidatus Methanodesulfokora washburnensis]|jgi:formate dehydrogenase iron-sulfur subunit|nr:4Fe-4S dicluster domain-containing protein [Candidatus Methanodesulfokores washburnensis]